jgi:thiol-disulfide isomerase/thioredoxin
MGIVPSAFRMLIEIEHSHEYLDAIDKIDVGEVVVLTAPGWCKPCQRLQPHIDLLSETVDIIYVDIDKTHNYMDTFPYVRSVPSLFVWTGWDFKPISGRTYFQIRDEIKNVLQ